MVSAAAAGLVIVLLQLHASDTLKEDNETAASPQPSPPSRPPPHGVTNTPTRIHNSQGGIFRQDEDLLDLMVRIAETPEEWERIHRVLSLIGQEKAYDTTENYAEVNNVKQITEDKNSTDNYLQSYQQNSFITDEASIEPASSSTTLAPHPVTLSRVKDIDDPSAEDTDTGWPDFEEAIVRKVKIPHAVDENDILETSWLEDDWLDPNWNNFLNGEQNKLPTSHLPNKISPVSFKTAENNEKNSVGKGDDVPRSRLYRDPKILEFRLENVIPQQNHTVDHNTSEETNGSSGGGERPVFVYHRVTTSPQERRGNAFIAVSVVRQGAAAPPPTTLPPRTLWDQLASRQNAVKDSAVPHQRKHPHWRQEDHWQNNRGRRHHHTHTHH